MNYLLSVSVGDFQWVEIIYAMVGSFVGIFIPLWIDKLRERRQQKDAQRKLLSSLRSELKSVNELIKEYNKPEHQYDIFSFSTFVWDSVISAGMLTDILSDENIQGTLLMEIYSELSLLGELHEEFCQRGSQEDSDMFNDLKSIYERIMQVREDVCEKTERYLVSTEKT